MYISINVYTVDMAIGMDFIFIPFIYMFLRQGVMEWDASLPPLWLVPGFFIAHKVQPSVSSPTYFELRTDAKRFPRCI